MTIRVTDNHLIRGDALAPHDHDLIAQEGRLAVGEPVPFGWNVLTGNNDSSLVGRVVFRFEANEGLSK
jgi:hypothetical protein